MIRKITSQSEDLTGKWVCPESIAVSYLCSMPRLVVEDKGLVLVICDKHDQDKLKKKHKKCVVFVCDTEEEGLRCSEAARILHNVQQELQKDLERKVSEYRRQLVAELTGEAE